MWQASRKKKLENNPNHAPAGDSKGGQFTKGDGGSGEPKNDKEPSKKKDVKIKFVGNLAKRDDVYKKNATILANKAINSLPSHLSDLADKITLTDSSGSDGRFRGVHTKFTGNIKILISSDEGYNRSVLAHELSHADFDRLSDSQQNNWKTSDIIKEPLTKYTQDILNNEGDKDIDVKTKFGIIKYNKFREEQYAELNRLVHTEPTKFMPKIIANKSTIKKQSDFLKQLRNAEEAVTLSGPQARADIKKKKKVAQVPRGFEFNETLDDSWREVEHYLHNKYTVTESISKNKLKKLWSELKPQQRRDLVKKMKLDVKIADIEFDDLSDMNIKALTSINKPELSVILTTIFSVTVAGLALTILNAPMNKSVSDIKSEPIPDDIKQQISDNPTSIGQQKSDTVGNPEFKAFTHSSSFVGNVLWDRESSEMDILLNGKTYHFCRVSERLFDSFEGASSKGAFFNREIKTLHDC